MHVSVFQICSYLSIIKPIYSRWLYKIFTRVCEKVSQTGKTLIVFMFLMFIFVTFFYFYRNHNICKSTFASLLEALKFYHLLFQPTQNQNLQSLLLNLNQKSRSKQVMQQRSNVKSKEMLNQLSGRKVDKR